MNYRLVAAAVAGSMAFPALAGYGKDDTQIVFSFAGAGNNVRLYLEVLAQVEKDLPGVQAAKLADRLSGHSTGGMVATLLTLPLHAEGRPFTAAEALAHLGTHGPRIFPTIGRGLNQADKARVQADARQVIGQALGAQGGVRVSALPAKIEVLMHEVVGSHKIPATFSAALASAGVVPDATATELLAAALSVEMLAGHTPLAGAGEHKASRTFVDSGSCVPAKTDPTPELIQAAVRSEKPAHIFAFEGGYGFEAETLAWAVKTQEAERMAASGTPQTEVDRTYGRVRVHLFQASGREHTSCAGCVNADGSRAAKCPEHAPNLTQLIGARVPAARMKASFDPRLRAMPLPILALNMLHGIADSEINGELSRIAQAQMIGAEEARTAPYRKLQAVLAEAAAAGSGSVTGQAPAETGIETKAKP